MPLSRAYRDREQDVLDQYHLGQITREKAAKLLTELYVDFYQAQSSLKMADEAEQTEG